MNFEHACPTCGEDVCIFLQFEADVIGLRRWNAAVMAKPTNRERRKMVFRMYFTWRSGGGGSRTKLERCVKIGVRTWFPSHAYMGFHDADNPSERKQAVDPFGNRINAWWVYKEGAWVLDKE